MIVFSSLLSRLFSSYTSMPTSDTGQEISRWSVEAHGDQFVLLIPRAFNLGPTALARLAGEVEEIRQAGFEVLLACGAGKALESLRRVHFHRFVDILPTRESALRFAQLSRPTEGLEAA